MKRLRLIGEWCAISLSLAVLAWTMGSVVARAINDDNKAVVVPAPIRITEPQDSLELQLGYERIVNAQLSFQNQLLRTEKKYKVPAGYNYSLENRQFEPPAQAVQPDIPLKAVPIKPNQ